MSEALMCETVNTIEKGDFYENVIGGLNRRDKKLHPKFFYDEKGSAFFDQICQLDEYYPYKTELALLPKVAKALTSILTDEYSLIEFGAGSLLKVQPLLDEIRGIQQFIPIDISGDHLIRSCQELMAIYPLIDVRPVDGDFTQEVDIPNPKHLKRLGFFPGSTIGNFSPSEASGFLDNARKTLSRNSHLLIGVDTKKSPAMLHRAYNDEQGVTAKFNKNILHRINQYFDSNIDVNKFEHYAFYNANKGCIEMHLVCLESQVVHLDDVRIDFNEGETIHTESSYKYAPNEFQLLAYQSGWATKKLWLSENNMFSMFLLKNMD